MNRVRAWWNQLNGKLGILLCLAGFVALFLGWNGAASYDRVPAQFPYLVSGGLVGLSLVVIGAAAMVIEHSRRARADLLESLAELRTALESSSGATRAATDVGPAAVLAGASSYHRPDCRLVQGRDNAELLTADAAEAQGLNACRICHPG
jgi:hypothetical protein